MIHKTHWLDWLLVPIVAVIFLVFALISWVFGAKKEDFEEGDEV